MGLLIAGIDLAARLAGIKRASDPDPAEDRVLRFGRPMRLALFALVAGLAAVIIGAAPQEILDELLESGVRYTRAGGINAEAEFLLWPMLILDKLEGLGYIAITLGTFGVALGAPRRRLSAWFDRRAGQPGARRYDAVIKKVGAVLLLAGFGAYWIDSYVVDQFLLPTIREIVIIASGDWSFLDDPANHPEWLQVVLAPLDIWALVGRRGAPGSCGRQQDDSQIVNSIGFQTAPAARHRARKPRLNRTRQICRIQFPGMTPPADLIKDSHLT